MEDWPGPDDILTFQEVSEIYVPVEIKLEDSERLLRGFKGLKSRAKCTHANLPEIQIQITHF